MTETHSINWQGLLDLPDPVKERAAKAIGRTIGVPWSSEIEETAVVLAQFASGEKVDETLGVQALRVVEADLAVLGRASSRLLAEAVLTQSNREIIAAMAADQLLTGADARDASEGQVEEGWLLTFAARAERTVDPVMRRVWAACLAQEILRPGAISTSLLATLSKLGERELGLINKYASLIVSGEFIPVDESDLGQLKSLFHLQSLGFVNGAGTPFRRQGTLDEEGVFWIPLGEEALVVQGEAGQAWSLGGVFASDNLLALAKVLDITPQRDALINVARQFFRMEWKKDVMRAKWTRDGDRVSFEAIEIYHKEPPQGAIVEKVG